MSSQKQKIINELAIEIGKIIDSNLKHITESQEKMLKKEERYLKNISKEKDSLVLLTLVALNTMEEYRYNDTRQKLEKILQDITEHIIQFYEEFHPQFETLYSILRKSPRGPVGKSGVLSSSSPSSVGFYVLLVLTLLVL
jgi:hypothetical protein